jgi:hypothetical protein
MKGRIIIITITILILASSGVYGTDLKIPQKNIFSSLMSSAGLTQTSNDHEIVSEYPDIKSTTIPFTEDSKTPVIRYTNENLPETINNLIEYIDFQTAKNIKGQVYIYFKLPSPDASVNQSKAVADFILSRKEWIGDRSYDSVVAEIYIHWVANDALPLFMTNPINEQLYKQYIIGIEDKRSSPISPTHLGYYYSGLDKTNLMDQFLLTL